MTILFATGIFPPDIGGPATYAKLFIKEWQQRGHEVHVVTYGPAGVSRRIPKFIRHSVYFAYCLWYGRTADCFFAQDLVGAGIPALCAARVLGRRLVIRVPGDYAWEISVQRFGVKDGIDLFQKKRYGWRTELLRACQRFVARHADAVICPSVYFRDLVSGWGVRAERLHAIPNGIEFPTGVPYMPYEQRERVLFSAGRLVPWKGFDVLIRCLPALPDWKLRIAGDGPDRARLESLVQEAGVSNRVTFLGQLPRDELFRQMSCARIFLHHASFESFSFQIVEAMYVGIPVVAASAGNLSEIIQHEHNGMLVPLNDFTAMHEAIQRLDTQAHFREQITRAARKTSEQFSMSATASRLEELLKRVC